MCMYLYTDATIEWIPCAWLAVGYMEDNPLYLSTYLSRQANFPAPFPHNLLFTNLGVKPVSTAGPWVSVGKSKLF